MNVLTSSTLQWIELELEYLCYLTRLEPKQCQWYHQHLLVGHERIYVMTQEGMIKQIYYTSVMGF